MTEHTNKQFSAELENVRSSFLQMGGLVEAMIGEAMNVLVNKEVTLADTVHDREKEVNRLEVEIDERIGLLIARNQPTAVDLRLLLSVSKMLTDMERCGDEADKIAKMARRMHEAGGQYIPAVELRHISTQVTNMIRNVLDAFAREDPIHAATVVRNDKEVDKEWKASLRHLITYMMEDPRTISRSIDLIFIARSLERIGDHAKNMAERVIYMVHGDDVRHIGVKATERVARGEPLVKQGD
ncbi:MULTISPECIES: phosphate signaling complex protein PhoU [Alcaligenaceae]|jgi:phosphate transport system protein|uniref:Phosphate-specific transport system accessory protein PhoU n=1 Tax=Neopusillimonas maritima TaxID=2026239 RepID=A0A3A1YUT4_9BURK|nr:MULTISPECIES: phosphate signaling complex protein PhoU [Alcaligenaceae]QIM49958.1 phosphate signaling complex protein PhoU [Pusillimonas sp. DMV24BSW_D]RII82654.1 phosphate transport system regulatory protein PhoU [Neopusillimonas maritima]RIY40204.1 phosphate transport system regulatory protein PhoU [Neopusillimonas maritima]|tara:strand:- start:21218 stop:21940 length:723 start_codon:yes stop_codon:yes gene_type:complete